MQSEQINELATALAKAQALFVSVPKTKIARIPTKAGGEYSYNYSDLADTIDMIRKPLSDNGLSIVQMPSGENGMCEVYTQLSHASGQWIGSTIRYVVSAGDIKLLGTAITYLRRYALAAMLGLASDDDDDGTGSTNNHGTTGARAQTGAQPANGNGHAPGKASEKQIKMLFAIWKNGGYDGSLKDWIAESFGCGIDDLSSRQASEAISTLKPDEKPGTVAEHPIP